MFVLRFITAKVVDLFTTPNFIALKTLNKLFKIEFEGGTTKEPNVIGIGTRKQKLRVQSGSFFQLPPPPPHLTRASIY